MVLVCVFENGEDCSITVPDELIPTNDIKLEVKLVGVMSDSPENDISVFSPVDVTNCAVPSDMEYSVDADPVDNTPPVNIPVDCPT
jgi:hypothetical protein